MKNLIKRMAFIWLFPDGVFISEDKCSPKFSHKITVFRSSKTGWLGEVMTKGVKMELPENSFI